QDATQDVLLKAWKALPQFEYKSEQYKFRSWLMIVCRNCLRDYAKSKRGKLDKLKVDCDGEIGLIGGSIEAEIDEIAEAEWKKYVAHMAWDNIAKQFSANVLEAFHMHAEECSTAEISAKLDMSEENIYVYRGRVRKALLKEILRLDTQLG
ncbi:MAG: sigma-70 family RNA polymerase sigma factor, partial [Lentisphaeraceae bacterium]|nr:sigma-70 family RNA polymerase sigma factor [Lentisphaeraceae bacterium]